MFDTLTDSFKNAVGKIRFHDDEKALKKALGELKKSLLKADVHYKVVKSLISRVETETKKAGIGKDAFLSALRHELTHILTAKGNQGFVFAPHPPDRSIDDRLAGIGQNHYCRQACLYAQRAEEEKGFDCRC